MTYVPDYIRPVGPKTSPTSPITRTPIGHTRRIASFAGHLTPSVPRERSSSTNVQLSEENIIYNRNRRRSASNPATNAIRFMKPSQERICGRVSIKERLKNLESEAAVKLELRNTAPRSKRRSSRTFRTNGGSDIHSGDSLSSSQAGSRKTSVTNKSDCVESDSSRSNISEVPREYATSMPKPDIIESHQPKGGSIEHIQENYVEKSMEINQKEQKLAEINKSNKNTHRRGSVDSRTAKLDIISSIEDTKHLSEPLIKVKDTTVLKPRKSKHAGSATERKKEAAARLEPTEATNTISTSEPHEAKASVDLSALNNRKNTGLKSSKKPVLGENTIVTEKGYESYDESVIKLPESNLILPQKTCRSNDRTIEHTLPKIAPKNNTGMSDGNSTDSSGTTKINQRPKSLDKLKTTTPDSGNILPNKLKGSAGSGLKLIWRTPSMKQMQRLNDNTFNDASDAKKEVADNDMPNIVPQNGVSTFPQESIPVHDGKENLPDLTTGNITTTPPTSIGSAFSKQQESTITGTVTSDATIDVITTQTYPVELRSPRNEHGSQANRRQDTKDKRNARVFIVPSSSDSDMDNNPVARMDRDFAKLGFTRAVDLLPKPVGINNNIVTKTKDTQQPIKHVTPVKFVPYVLKSNYTESKSEEKKDSSMDSSSNIYPELLMPSRTARKESNPNSKSIDSERKKDSQKSPSRRRKSTRSGRSGGNRSKSTDTRRIYNEQQRHRSNSMCDAKRDQQRQESVAHAVIFGNAPDNTIPYIDDTASPTDETKTEGAYSHPRRMSMSDGTGNRLEIGPIHRSNSADVLSSMNVKKSPAKMRRTRALSADRTVTKGVHRRSYQIATMTTDAKGDPKHKQNIEKFKTFQQDSDLDNSMNADRSIDSSIDDPQRTTRSGYLHFKVATIDKGKRTSSQKSWKSVSVALKDHHLHLSKDWSKSSKNNQEAVISRQMSIQEDVQPLNIQSSLVGIAYNYLKRKNVFKLTTFNGSEYLFQAENRDDMLAWISAIQNESCSWEDGGDTINEDLILRKTNQIESGPKSDKKVSRKRSPKPNVKNNLQVKDVDGSRRFKWRGSVNKIVKKFGTGQPFLLNGTFGVHLEDCPPSPVNEFVPYVVELCCRIMEDRGLHTTGIYRVPGNNAALLALQEDLNIHSVEMLRPDDERLRDLNIVSSLLKSFFRKLPEPMFTNELYHDFVQANRSPTSESRLNGLRRLVHMLPGPHYETLKFLISHLRLIADNCGENKMEVRNLAIVFGPTLVRNTAADNTATMVTDMSDQCRIIESIIEHAEWFFSDAFDPAIEEPNVPGVPTEREHEAVPNIEFLLENVGRKPGDTGNTSESTKSKASDDSEKDSFSRDLVEMFFGKKWRQANQANQPATVEDHGGFEDYEYRRRQETTPKKEETSSENIEPPKSPDSIQVSSIPNVSERLLQFYNEHLERLSQTTIGLTFPAFSSADSSPRTTPRHSTILNAPLVFPTPGQARNFGSRNRINSDQSQDGRYGVSSVEIHPSQKTPPFPLPEALGRSKGVPQYKHPPNPYNKGVSDATPKQTISSRSTTTFSNSSALNTPATTLVSDSNRGKSQNNSTSPGVKMRKHSSSKPLVPDIATNVRRNLKENYPDRRVQNMAPAPSRNPALTTNEDKDTPPMNERLVGELPKTVHPPRVSSPTTLRGNRSPKQPTKSKSEHVDIKRKTSSSSIQASEDNRSRQNTKEMTRRTDPDLVADSQQKRRKSPLKENVVVNKSIPERTFSRYDPKRRGIRFAGTENEPTNSGVLTSSPAKHLTATERLFNTQQQQQQQQQQPIRRRLSVREHKKNSVIRRHTLSGIQDLEEHSPLLANKSFKSNLKQVAMGQNLSMYDITTISGPGQSAMERLNPKGASRGMTLSNWIVRERVRNKTVQRNGCPMGVGGGKPALSKKDKLKDAVRVHSYV